ncbi:hypothetical protein BHE74_00002934 [Ensete ventricosum]|uniref:Uncharacterized protein n=1 Tax=Ensete ventricosum TaxID=4639 RepID=A0A444FSW2_ENSVE|nr:hypothetical protein GW17_00009911 [Ensete ventricosum]RWW88200.1 hypothetical protein BHE74_00002934 [Ensete ventricosum]RZR71589.1 hypothetical protein BHM03_00005961 [Ensete ventricosum]
MRDTKDEDESIRPAMGRDTEAEKWSSTPAFAARLPRDPRPRPRPPYVSRLSYIPGQGGAQERLLPPDGRPVPPSPEPRSAGGGRLPPRRLLPGKDGAGFSLLTSTRRWLPDDRSRLTPAHTLSESTLPMSAASEKTALGEGEEAETSSGVSAASEHGRP